MNKYKLFSYGLIIVVIVLGIIGVIVLKLSLIEVVIVGILFYLNHWFIRYLSRNQTKIVCDKCHHKNPMNSVNCAKCGNDIENIICPTCKGINQYNQKYCTECETKLICGECSI